MHNMTVPITLAFVRYSATWTRRLLCALSALYCGSLIHSIKGFINPRHLKSSKYHSTNLQYTSEILQRFVCVYLTEWTWRLFKFNDRVRGYQIPFCMCVILDLMRIMQCYLETLRLLEMNIQAVPTQLKKTRRSSTGNCAVRNKWWKGYLISQPWVGTWLLALSYVIS